MAKLSKREQAAKAAGVKVDYTKSAKQQAKVAPRPSTPVAAKPLVGAGPLLPGQSRVQNSYGGGSAPLVGAGPLLPGQNRVQDSYKGGTPSPSKPKPKPAPTQSTSNSRSMASQAFNGLMGINTAQAAGNDATPNTNSSPRVSGLGSFLSGAKGAVNAVNPFAGHAPDFGVTEALGLNKYFKSPTMAFNVPDNKMGIVLGDNIESDVPTAYGDNGETFFNGNTKQNTLASDFATPGTNFSRPGSEQAYNRGEDPRYSNNGMFGVPLDQTKKNEYFNPTKNTPNINRGGGIGDRPYGPERKPQDYVPQNQGNEEQAAALMELLNQSQGGSQDIASAPSAAPSMDFPTDGSMQYPGGTKGNRSGRGSGMFGNGKGIQGDDSYIKEFRKSLSGYGQQENDVNKQFEDLIRALDPTYDQYKKEGQTTLEQQQANDLQKLASVMNANNTGDSEQRVQMMQNTQRDYGAQLANLLSKLDLQKNQDITGYKTKAVDAVNNIRTQKQSAQERLAQLMQAFQEQQYNRQRNARLDQRDLTNDAFDQRYKTASLAGKGSGKIPGVNSAWGDYQVSNFANQMLQQGYGWQDIADTARANNIDVSQGGYFDNYMRNVNGLAPVRKGQSFITLPDGTQIMQ